MSEERSPITIGDPKITRNEKKAKLARVLERGVVVDRLNVDLPPELYGEWVSDDPVSIASMEALGFYKDTNYATKNSLHSTGTQEGRVGDTIFMVCDREVKEIIDEIRRDQFERTHGRTRQREDKEGVSLVEKSGLPTFTESKEHVAKKADIEAALKATIPEGV